MHKAILAMRRAKMPIMTEKPETEFLAEDVAFHLLLLRASGNTLAENIIANTYRRHQSAVIAEVNDELLPGYTNTVLTPRARARARESAWTPKVSVA